MLSIRPSVGNLWQSQIKPAKTANTIAKAIIVLMRFDLSGELHAKAPANRLLGPGRWVLIVGLGPPEDGPVGRPVVMGSLAKEQREQQAEDWVAPAEQAPAPDHEADHPAAPM